jgi:hypothetical protein
MTKFEIVGEKEVRNGERACAPRNVKLLRESCWHRSKLESITLERELRLAQIGEACFLWCSLKSITIPRNIEMLGKLCFTE